MKTRSSKRQMKKSKKVRKSKSRTMKKYHGGGQVKNLFLEAITKPENPAAGNVKRTAYKDFETFFQKEAGREKKTLTQNGNVFTYWLSGIRPINFVVETTINGKTETEIVGSVSD